MKLPKNVHINNVPDYAYEKPCWVIRNCEEDGYWFYGAYDNIEKAFSAATICVNGIVIFQSPDE